MIETPFFLEPPKTVHPSTVKHTRLPIIIATTHAVLVERTGLLYERKDDEPRGVLRDLILEEPPSLWAVHKSLALLGEMDELLRNHPRWQWRTSSIDRELWTAASIAGQARIFKHLEVVSYFGLRQDGNRKSHWHYMLDPIVFSGQAVTELMPNRTHLIDALSKWSHVIESLAYNKRLRITPTKGGMIAAMLRHPSIYPESRRRVPHFINTVARAALPGNHYDYKLPFNEIVSHAICLDQENAHHNAALHLEFPDANSLFAHGAAAHIPDKADSGIEWHYNRGQDVAKRWSNELLKRPGLFYVRIAFLPHRQKGFFPPWAKQAFDAPSLETTAFLYSNELPFLKQLGGKVEQVIACWVSDEPEQPNTGIKAYANWALDYLRDNNQDKAAIKPVLLSLYGILGARPVELRFSYAKSKSKRALKRTIKTNGAWSLHGNTLVPRSFTSPIANVIQRGMIEAEVRQQTIRFANHLLSTGLDVLGLHADAIYLRNADLPLLDHPWRNKFGTLRNHSFPYAGAIRNDKERKYPGITKEQQKERADADDLERKRQAA